MRQSGQRDPLLSRQARFSTHLLISCGWITFCTKTLAVRCGSALLKL